MAHVFRGPKVLGMGSYFQRTKDSGSWLMFSEDLEFWDRGSCFSEDLDFLALAHVLKGPMVLDTGSCFQTS